MSSIVRDHQGPIPIHQIKYNAQAKPGGMRPDIDPSALSPNDFVLLYNTRRAGTSIISRPTERVLATFTLDETPAVQELEQPLHLTEVVGNTRNMVMTISAPGGCTASNVPDTYGLVFFSHDLTNGYELPFYSPAEAPMKVCHFQRGLSSTGMIPPVDNLFVASGNILYRYEDPEIKYGMTLLSALNGKVVSEIWRLPSDYTDILFLAQYGDSMYIYAEGPSSRAIFSWDGLTFRLDRNTASIGAKAYRASIQYRDSLVAWGMGDTVATVDIRSAAGVWSNLYTGVAGENSEGLLDAALFEDQLWLNACTLYPADTAHKLFNYDMTTGVFADKTADLTAAGLPSDATITSIFNGFGDLCITFTTATGLAPGCYLGRKDPVTGWDLTQLIWATVDDGATLGVRNYWLRAARQFCGKITGTRIMFRRGGSSPAASGNHAVEVVQSGFRDTSTWEVLTSIFLYSSASATTGDETPQRHIESVVY